MAKKIIGILLSIFIFSNLAIYSDDLKVITAATDPWPPYVDPDNPTGGFSIEIINAAFKTQGYKLELHIVPWARAMIGVENGVYDILPNAWKNSDRTKFMLFSNYYTINKIKVISLKSDNFIYTNINSFKDKSIGIIRGYSYSQEFIDSDIFKRVETPYFFSNIKILLAKRVDLTLEDEMVAKFIISKEDPEILNELKFSEKSFSEQKLYISSGYKNPRHEEIINAFNRGLEIIKENGVLEEIEKKYLIKELEEPDE